MTKADYIPHSKPCITAQDQDALRSVLEGGMLAAGQECARFEKDFSAYTGFGNAFVTPDGKTALQLALEGVGVRGGEVIQPFYVCDDVRWAVERAGAKAVFCDLGEGFQITAESVEKHITPATKAIIVVHALGMSANLQGFEKFGVPVVEDCCQALAPLPKTPALKAKRIAAYSFHPTKCITAGSGGAVATDNSEWAAYIEGRISQNESLRLNDLCWALANTQLAQYEGFVARRAELAQRYLQELPAELTSEMASCADDVLVWFRFMLNISDPSCDFETVKEAFEAKGMAVRKPVHLVDMTEAETQSYPRAAARLKHTLSLPLYPALTDAQQDRVIEAVHDILVG